MSPDAEVVVRPAARDDYAAGARLLAAALRFSAHEAIPGWQMLTSATRGGVALAAWRGGELVGWSYGFPALDAGRPYLFSCGLAVRADARSRGVGRALKQAQRTSALRLGYDVIRWTADPLSSSALYLYLTVLGARITGYAAGLYDGVREGRGLPQDDVEVEWSLRSERPDTRTTGETARVELPWDVEGLIRDDADEALRWRTRVRGALSRLLGDGYRGVEVAVDRPARRSFLLLTPP
jgi:predicted GNAT superfamily acetyltransferase